MAHNPPPQRADCLIHTAFPFVDFLYILQLEDYNSKNYVKWVGDRLFKRSFQKVGHITWTDKAKMLLGLSFVVYLIAVQQIAVLIPTFWWLILVLIMVSFLIPYVILISNLVFSLIDIVAKKQTIAKAKLKLESLPNCTVVAVVGSQGKTSTRQFICQLLEGTRKYHTPPQNHNVALSLARDILTELNSSTEICVVEFGELYKGDLTYLYRFLHPKIIVATSISSQHIGQFGSQRAIDQEFLSLFNAATDATIIVNDEDAGLARLKPLIQSTIHGYNSRILDDLARVATKSSVLEIPIMRANAAGAVAVVQQLNVPNQAIAERLATLELPDQRLKVQKHGDITIIDDSYNISPESASSALDYLKIMPGRKVVVTGGIVDQGSGEMEANERYGKQLAKTVDVIVVANNRLSAAVKKGIASAHKQPEVITSPHPSETPQILQQTLAKGDSVLVQNELPDLYWN